MKDMCQGTSGAILLEVPKDVQLFHQILASYSMVD